MCSLIVGKNESCIGICCAAACSATLQSANSSSSSSAILSPLGAELHNSSREVRDRIRSSNQYMINWPHWYLLHDEALKL